MKVDFDEPTHTYKIDGKVVPSVTQCLQLLDPYASVDRAVLEAAAAFGQSGHTAMALLVRGRLSWKSLDRALVPYIEAGAEWLKHAQADMLITSNERIVAHELLGYAGTLDLTAVDDRSNYIIEFKFTSALSLTVGPQTAAYEHAIRASSENGIRHWRRLCVTISAGKYSVDEMTNPGDWPMFVSCLNITKWKWKHGIK